MKHLLLIRETLEMRLAIARTLQIDGANSEVEDFIGSIGCPALDDLVDYEHNGTLGVEIERLESALKDICVMHNAHSLTKSFCNHLARLKYTNSEICNLVDVCLNAHHEENF